MLVKDAEQNNDEGDHVLLKNKVTDISELKLPSFAATNSLVLKIDTTLTNIFSTPLVPGPASSYSAIYTALMRAQNVSTWSCGDSSKVVLFLDLDLYEQAYMLVNSNSDLRKRFILCLGELHIRVFAHIRGIGTYVSNSGLDTAWMHANWFDSPCLLRQVMECLNMKRAISTLKSTVVTIEFMLLKEVIVDNDDAFDDELANLLHAARSSLEELKIHQSLSQFGHLCAHMLMK